MSTALVWLRQDLRLSDNPALSAAAEHEKVIFLYIYDEDFSHLIGSAQRWWLFHSLSSLSQTLREKQQFLCLRRGHSAQILSEIMAAEQVSAVYWNRCYEPELIARDKQIKAQLKSLGIEVKSFNGSLLQEPWQILNQSGDFYKVYTPYWKQALRQIAPQLPRQIERWPTAIHPASDRLESWALLPKNPDWASQFSRYWQPGEAAALKRLEDFIATDLDGYQQARDYPAKGGTSGLSPHLHFGEISPRQIWHALQSYLMSSGANTKSAECFLSELGWREFSTYLLYHYPSLSEKNFRPAFDNFPWEEDEGALQHWQQGTTGYPLVDAGMRELWETGYMHNRVRMIVASFLTKDLLIPWQKGAAWFYDCLLDADLANNSAGWQWTAGSGADAAPYFRIFNPVSQSQKFDPEAAYIRRWLPELAHLDNQSIHMPWKFAPSAYPAPIIDHGAARQRALEAYKQCTKSS